MGCATKPNLSIVMRRVEGRRFRKYALNRSKVRDLGWGARGFLVALLQFEADCQ